GAAVALAAAETRDDIAAMILECPFTQYSHAVRAHAGVQNLPATSLIPLVLKLAQKMSGANFDQVKPVDLIPRAKCPLLLISGAEDPFAPPKDLHELERVIAARDDPRSEFWKVCAGHVLCITPDPESYRSRIEAFLEKAAKEDHESARINMN